MTKFFFISLELWCSATTSSAHKKLSKKKPTNKNSQTLHNTDTFFVINYIHIIHMSRNQGRQTKFLLAVLLAGSITVAVQVAIQRSVGFYD
jgi:hypothetical protein